MQPNDRTQRRIWRRSPARDRVFAPDQCSGRLRVAGVKFEVSAAVDLTRHAARFLVGTEPIAHLPVFKAVGSYGYLWCMR